MSWDDLSMREKAAMMRVAVKNKIFEIDKIKEAYDSQGKQVSNSEVINPNQYTPSVNLNVNPALDYVGNALESISGYEYEGNPLNKLGIDMSFDLGTTGSSMYPNGVRFVKKFDDGGPKKRYISYYELANNPDKYGYHLDADKKNGKEVYYNAANQQWFYADKAKDKNNLSEITEDYLDMPENKQAEFKRENEFNLNQPATMNYISSQIEGMKTPAEIQAIQNAHKEQAKEMIEWFPFVGDAIDGYGMAKDVYTDIKKGDYTGATATAATGILFALAPEWLEQGIKKGWRYMNDFYGDGVQLLKNKFMRSNDNGIIFEEMGPKNEILPQYDSSPILKNSLNGNRIDLTPKDNEWEDAKRIRDFWGNVTMKKYNDNRGLPHDPHNNIPPGEFILVDKNTMYGPKNSLGWSANGDAYIKDITDNKVPIDEVVVHEGKHNLVDNEPEISIFNEKGEFKSDAEWEAELSQNNYGYTEQEKQILDDAYEFDMDYQFSNLDTDWLAEKGATNTQLQYKLLKEHDLKPEDLNDFIDNIGDEELLEYLSSTGAYGQSFGISASIGNKANNLAKIREALKKVPIYLLGTGVGYGTYKLTEDDNQSFKYGGVLNNVKK